MLICSIGLGFSLSGAAGSSVAYISGPAFSIPDAYNSTSLDLDQDGVEDFSFSSGPFICTTDVPSSGCTSPYFITSLGPNNILCQGNEAVVLPAGTTIGMVTSSNSAWRSSDGATVATAFFSPRYDTSGWGGPLSAPGAGYLGIRFHSQDGLHYGWIHVWLPDGGPFGNSPVVLDWASETSPDAPIDAGLVPSAPLVPPRMVRAGNLRLDWQSEVGAAYQVQFKDQLASPVWTNADFTIVATATNTSVDVPMPGAARFYRIAQLKK
jgi:hypothetical protein